MSHKNAYLQSCGQDIEIKPRFVIDERLRHLQTSAYAFLLGRCELVRNLSLSVWVAKF